MIRKTVLSDLLLFISPSVMKYFFLIYEMKYVFMNYINDKDKYGDMEIN